MDLPKETRNWILAAIVLLPFQMEFLSAVQSMRLNLSTQCLDHPKSFSQLRFLDPELHPEQHHQHQDDLVHLVQQPQPQLFQGLLCQKLWMMLKGQMTV